MLPTRTPQLLKWVYPSLVWDEQVSENSVYITFDDGPHPNITPWVLDELDKFGFKATFFCIGANVSKYPESYSEILKRGHQTGNHTYNHLRGFHTDNTAYYENIEECAQLVNSKLFRPPHGQLTPSQVSFIKQKYKIIMWSLLAEDWNEKLDAESKLQLMKAFTQKGDIVVFHDSDKAQKNLEFLLPKYLEFLAGKGFKSLLLSVSVIY